MRASAELDAEVSKVAEACLKEAIVAVAKSSYLASSIPPVTIRGVRRCVERHLGLNTSLVHAALTLAGRILGKYAIRDNSCRPSRWIVTPELIERLFGVSYRDVRDRAIMSLDPVEWLYLKTLVRFGWND